MKMIGNKTSVPMVITKRDVEGGRKPWHAALATSGPLGESHMNARSALYQAMRTRKDTSSAPPR